MSEETIASTTAPTAERRRRIKRPWRITALAWFFILLPLLNLLLASRHTGYPLSDLPLILARFDLVGLILLISAPVVGVGLLQVERWSWYLFLGYMAAMIGYNLFETFAGASNYRFASLLRTLVGFSIAFYFLRRDFYSPYLSVFQRGFRRQRRDPGGSIALTLEDRPGRILDISPAGVSVADPGLDLDPGQAVRLRLTPDGEQPLELKAGVARVDADSVGLAFRGLDRATRKRLAAIL